VTDTETRLKALMLRGLDGDAAAYRECLAVLGVRLRAYFARYKLIDHWRRRKVRQTLPIEDHIEFLAADEPDPGVGLELDRALATLPDKQRTLVSDVKLTGLSLAEAGAKAGMSEGAAKVALHRALKALAERMRRADR
jgi:RNA polymerase sigma-70 factor (ECF subfamily)